MGADEGLGAAVKLFEDQVWQMSYGERAAIEGLLSGLRPKLAIEVGTAEARGCAGSPAAPPRSTRST